MPSVVVANQSSADATSSPITRINRAVVQTSYPFPPASRLLQRMQLQLQICMSRNSKKNRIHQAVRQLRDSIKRVKSEKHKLATQLVLESSSEKKNRAMIDLLQMQIKELADDQKKQEEEIQKLVE